MGYWSDSLQYTQVIYDHHYLTIPFNVWGAVLSRPGPAVLLRPLWKPPPKFSAYAPGNGCMGLHDTRVVVNLYCAL